MDDGKQLKSAIWLTSFMILMSGSVTSGEETLQVYLPGL